jgi:DNA-binding MarR family transcriptional regulator
MDAFGAFMRSYKGWMRTVLAELSSGESNPSRVMLVVSLRRTSPQAMGSLALHLGLPKSNITALVDDLEAEGVLRRKQDPTDRRVTLLELTAKGHSLCEREYDAYERSMAGLFALLPAEERVPMFAGLERMTAHLREEDERGTTKSNGANSLGSRRAAVHSGTKSFKK